MKLPVDIKALLSEVTTIDAARKTSVSVSVYIDDTSPLDVQRHVCQLFRVDQGKAHVSLNYLDAHSFEPHVEDDMAVVVAGLNEQVGAYAQRLRAAGIPVMVVTTLPSLVAEIAQVCGHVIPQGDLLAPRQSGGRIFFGAKEQSCAMGYAEPVNLDESLADTLSERMGAWMVDACSEKHLAFAQAFPFVRRPLSLESVHATALQNAGVGLLLIIPGADLPVMTLNQAKMLLMIAAAYGEELNMGRIKELVALVGGAFTCRAVARQLASLVPGFGWAVKAGIGYSGTLAMGRAAIEYYENSTGLAHVSDTFMHMRDVLLQKVVRKAG